MGVRSWLASRRTADTRWADRTGSMAFGRFDSKGRPVATFEPTVDNVIRVDGFGMSPGAIYESQPAVRLCVRFLAKNIAHLNIKVFRKESDGERTSLPDHPLAKLLQQPNPRTTRYDLMRGTVSDLAIYDNAFWLKRQVGQARQLLRIPPVFVFPKGGSILTGPERYEVNLGNEPRTFDPAEIVHFHGYHPHDTRTGMSVLESLRNVVAEEVASTKHRQNYWRNAARREGVIETNEVLSDVAYERLRQSWQNHTAGAQNAGKTGIVEAGRFRDSSFSPRDSEFIAGREWALDMVATGYDIPLAMLSRKGAATFASMKEFRTILYVDVLGPWNSELEDAMKLFLIPDFGDPDLYVEFNIEEKIQGDFLTQVDAFRQSGQVPWQSVNGIRKLRNEPPFGDPDDEENPFNWPARPTNYVYGNPENDEPAVAVPTPLAPAALEAELAAILEER